VTFPCINVLEWQKANIPMHILYKWLLYYIAWRIMTRKKSVYIKYRHIFFQILLSPGWLNPRTQNLLLWWADYTIITPRIMRKSQENWGFQSGSNILKFILGEKTSSIWFWRHQFHCFFQQCLWNIDRRGTPVTATSLKFSWLYFHIKQNFPASS
jgi:hypothetical protein